MVRRSNILLGAAVPLAIILVALPFRAPPGFIAAGGSSRTFEAFEIAPPVITSPADNSARALSLCNASPEIRRQLYSINCPQ